MARYASPVHGAVIFPTPTFNAAQQLGMTEEEDQDIAEDDENELLNEEDSKDDEDEEYEEDTDDATELEGTDVDEVVPGSTYSTPQAWLQAVMLSSKASLLSRTMQFSLV